MEKITLSSESLLATSSLDPQGAYVGVDLNEYYFDDNDLNKQFFNGAFLKKCLFKSLEIKHSEIREAKFVGCQFINCDLTSSDFVYSKFIKCSFINCQFANGEWIESEFSGCQFTESTFSHTTMNLNSFCECEFDSISAEGLNDRSVQYNVFENSTFNDSGNYGKCIDRNFGICSESLVTSFESSPDLFTHISRQYFAKQLPTDTFIFMIDKIVEQLIANSHRSYILRIKYLSLICSSYIKIEAVSPLGIQWLEKAITSKAHEIITDSYGLYAEILQLLMVIRLLYSNRTTYIETTLTELQFSGEVAVRSWVLRFNKSYTEQQVASLQEYVMSYCGLNKNSIHYRIQTGSIEIISELITQTPIYLAALYGAYASALKAVDLITEKTLKMSERFLRISENLAETKKNVKETFQYTFPKDELTQESREEKVKTSDLIKAPTKLNIAKVISGKFEGELSSVTISLANNDSSRLVLEIEDYATLCITKVDSNN